jgi:hypothetical protein
VGEKEDKKRTNSSNNKKYVDIQASYNLALEKINQLENIVDKLKYDLHYAGNRIKN